MSSTAALLAAADTLHFAQLTENSGNRLRDIVLGIVGALVLAFMAARMLGAYADDRYGKMLGLFAAGALIAGIASFPDTAMQVLQGLFTTVFGGSEA